MILALCPSASSVTTDIASEVLLSWIAPTAKPPCHATPSPTSAANGTISSRPGSPESNFTFTARPVSVGPSTKGGSGDAGAHLRGALAFGGAVGCTSASGGGGGDFLHATSKSASVSGNAARRILAVS